MMTYRPLIWSRPQYVEPSLEQTLQPEPAEMRIPIAAGSAVGRRSWPPSTPRWSPPASPTATCSCSARCSRPEALSAGSAGSPTRRAPGRPALLRARRGADLGAGHGGMGRDRLGAGRHRARAPRRAPRTSEQGVRGLIAASLGALAENRGLDFPHSGAEVVGAPCTGTPVCALVVAAFEAEPWGREAAAA